MNEIEPRLALGLIVVDADIARQLLVYESAAVEVLIVVIVNRQPRGLNSHSHQSPISCTTPWKQGPGRPLEKATVSLWRGKSLV